MTHSDLVALAVRWLSNTGRCPLVWAEAKGCYEEPDAFGIRSFGPSSIYTIVIEAKVSRSDFLADKRKIFRRCPALGMGRQRYYIAPKGLIGRHEVPPGWGLIEATDGRCRRVQCAPNLTVWNVAADMALMGKILIRQHCRMQELAP